MLLNVNITLRWYIMYFLVFVLFYELFCFTIIIQLLKLLNVL